jgi:predicted  nucleic acid-binding Zn-ribbon protein
MSESLSKEALLEYVKKQKQKIKKLEQELSDEKEKAAAAAPKFSAIPDLAALQDEISGGISSFFGITSPSATTETPTAQNNGDVTSEDASKNILATKDAELTSSLLREKKLKALIKVKIKEVDDKEKEVQQCKALLAAERDGQKPNTTDCSTVSSSNQLASLQQEIDELKARLQEEQRENGENSVKSETTAAKAGNCSIELYF